jgi:adenylyltransferase/sulfurtransferase
MRFAGVGPDGQRRLAAGRVALVGCGALGTVLASSLVRAGVGFVRLVDRDFIEMHNLQRQILFDEDDVAANLPKAEAAARKLRRVNSAVTVEPVVADVDRTNVLDLVRDADLILDGTDNFEVRYLLNDAAVSLGKPWVYGGCVGSHGMTTTVLPGETPCLRCVFEAAPSPGEVGTCETAGVIGPIVNVVASFQAAEALKILAGRRDAVNRDLLMIDVWENTFRRLAIGTLRDKRDCVCCKQRRFEWLDGAFGSQTTSMCGRNAVQVSHLGPGRVDLEDLARRLRPVGPVTANKFLLKFAAEGHEFTVFPDGRAIIQGTSDTDKARTLYAKYVGH